MEVAVSTLLVGLLLVGALRSVGSVWRTWQEAAARTQRMNLAREMMAEVLDQPYYDPDGVDVAFGLDSGESSANRSTFDDSDDFDGWTASPPEDRTGTDHPNLTGWTRSVVVDHVSAADPNTVVSDVAGEQGVRRVSVTVTDPTGRSTTLVAVRALPGEYPRSPDVASSAVSRIGVALQAGTGPAVESVVDVTSEAYDR